MKKLDFYDREDRPWPNPRLTNSAVVGHVTTTTARLWLRTSEQGKFRLFVSLTPIDPELQLNALDGVAAQTHDHDFEFDTDLTHVFDLEGLSPGVRHYYALHALFDRKQRWELGLDAALSFVTQPENEASVTFGLISCHMPYDNAGNLFKMQMWEFLNETLRDSGAQFLLAGGDQVYVDGCKRFNIWDWLRKVKNELPADVAERKKIMISWYRDIYRGYWGPLPLREVFRSFPTYMMWDDHEIMDGWGSYTRKELSNLLDSAWEWENETKNVKLAFEMFEAAKQVYFEYEHSHNPVTPAEQWDYSFNWGNFAFFALDMRGNRQYQKKSRAILGDAQMKRFLEWVDACAKSNTAKALFVLSPVPVVHAASYVVNTVDLAFLGVADDLRDEWEHKSNWRERDEMLDAVFEASVSSGKPVVFLSGDVHLGAAFKLSRSKMKSAKVFQLTSSAITYTGKLGPLIKLAVKDHGVLGAPDDVLADERTAFNLLQPVFERNNFGIVRAGTQGGKTTIHWDLFGESQDTGQIVKLRRVTLE